MEMFIRIDQKGTWRGTEHISAFGQDDWERTEPGISCYSLRYGNADGIKNLLEYWNNYNNRYFPEEFEGFQVTVFRGEKVGEGTDFEDCAICTETVAEIDAVEFVKMVREKEEDLSDAIEDDAEYEAAFEDFLNNINFEELRV